MTLGEFCRELDRDEDLLKEYKKNPRKVAEKKGLSEAHVELIVAGDLHGIRGVLQAEYGGQAPMFPTIVIVFRDRWFPRLFRWFRRLFRR